MLGSIKGKNTWQWLVFGKHPVAKDYFQVGSDVSMPMLMAFSDWVDNGYRLIQEKPVNTEKINSWRFWAPGAKKEMIIFGVGKDSSDRIGRPYPLIVIGTGMLTGWKKHWDLLPFALEKNWLQMEYLSTRRFMDFKQLENELRMLRSPEPRWLECLHDRERRYTKAMQKAAGTGWDTEKIRTKISLLSHQSELIVSVNPGPGRDNVFIVGLWHTLIKDFLKKLPNAVFTGGTQNKMNLAVFRKALSPDNFRRLWVNAGSQ
jgi:type VI secretion system protein VasJ